MINMHQNSQFTLGNMEERRKMQTVLYSSASEPNSIICSAQSRTLSRAYGISNIFFTRKKKSLTSNIFGFAISSSKCSFTIKINAQQIP